MQEKTFVKVGDRVMVYRKPYSMEGLEGAAQVVSISQADVESAFVEVRFDEDADGVTVYRWVLPNHVHKPEDEYLARFLIALRDMGQPAMLSDVLETLNDSPVDPYKLIVTAIAMGFIHMDGELIGLSVLGYETVPPAEEEGDHEEE